MMYLIVDNDVVTNYIKYSINSVKNKTGRNYFNCLVPLNTAFVKQQWCRYMRQIANYNNTKMIWENFRGTWKHVCLDCCNNHCKWLVKTNKAIHRKNIFCCMLILSHMNIQQLHKCTHCQSEVNLNKSYSAIASIKDEWKFKR